MKEFGIKQIIYSTNNGIIKKKFRDYTPKIETLGRLYIKSEFNIIHRTELKRTFLYIK